jgi:hypothetical protein
MMTEEERKDCVVFAARAQDRTDLKEDDDWDRLFLSAYRELKERREDEEFLLKHTYEVVPHKDGSVELYLDCCGQTGRFKGLSLHAACEAARGRG